MDPTKLVGKIREQVDRENVSRRNYLKKFGYRVTDNANKIYNPDFMNIELNRTSSNIKAFNPYQYDGHGDSYFLSKDMHQILLKKCRCGQPRTDGHLIKCLQKGKNKYENFDASTTQPNINNTDKKNIDSSGIDIDFNGNNKNNGFHNVGHKNCNTSNIIVNARKQEKDVKSNNNNVKSLKKIPETSTGMIGWPKNRYIKWEQSTRYISPIYTMPGYRVSDHPYSNIFIG